MVGPGFDPDDRRALAEYLGGLWNELRAWLDADLARPQSEVRSQVASFAATSYLEAVLAVAGLVEEVEASTTRVSPVCVIPTASSSRRRRHSG